MHSTRGASLLLEADDARRLLHSFEAGAVPGWFVGELRRLAGTAVEPLDAGDVETTAQAAERLGISERAVRGRLERGSLAGEKRAGRWFVVRAR